MIQVLLGEVSFEAGAGMGAIDPGMRVAIAAQAALLLLNFPLDDLPSLRSVILYPGAYRARERLWTPEGTQVDETEERHGETWSHGVLLLSWEDVRYDLEHVGDGQNVVVHEVAHAIDDLTGESDGSPRWRTQLPSAVGGRPPADPSKRSPETWGEVGRRCSTRMAPKTRPSSLPSRPRPSLKCRDGSGRRTRTCTI